MTIEEWSAVEEAVNDTCVLTYTVADLARQVLAQAAAGNPVRGADVKALEAMRDLAKLMKDFAEAQFKADMEAIALAGMLDMPQREIARLTGVVEKLEAAVRMIAKGAE
jgi:hypothetical protein